METDLPWNGVFVVLDSDGSPLADQGLPLRQVTSSRFEVGAAIRYVGETGLAPERDDLVRLLPLDRDRRSDLASVPAVLRWFERPHGVHTPAALFHDYLLGQPEIPAVEADLLFRNMLVALQVPRVRRNLLWAAVAMRTRWVEHRASLILWVVLSVLGLLTFVVALVGLVFGGFDLPSWTGGNVVALVVSALAPLPASLLWGGARKAALIAAFAAIWMLPAAAIALLALAVYRVLEFVAGRFYRDG